MSQPGLDANGALDLLRADPAHTAICTDFDGTLADIVTKPEDAVPHLGVVPLLTGLAERYARVAVISGRPLAYLQRYFAAPLVLSGLYGLESERDGVAAVHDDAAPWRAVAEQVRRRGELELPDGVGIEAKGLALTLHYRSQPDLQQLVEDWAERQAQDTGLAIAASRMSVELNPPVNVDKGVVLTEVAAGFSTVCFLGDDRGDVPAFRSLSRLRSQGLTTVAVGVVGAETPPEVVDVVDFTVDGPAAAVEFLSALLD